MSYQILSRKWRPQKFEEVVGQPHVVKTLQNAVSQKRIAQAYLFAGPRGTGKTTTARILSKCLNCEKSPTFTPSPCGECSNCREIARGESLDVLEIDGASNRGIEEIRELRERIKFHPAKSRRKVYIIDEVHMLTPEAFNALLKTLEEPPEWVTFIFCTTAPHKLPPTIISRCQRFDFHKLSTSEIFARLKEIVEKEKKETPLEVSEEALLLIAEAAENSMRDAESLLDQAISYGGGKISEKEVAELLGIVERTYLYQLTKNVAKKRVSENLKLISQILREGKSPLKLLQNWHSLIREILLLKLGQNLPEWLTQEEKEKMKTLERYFTLSQLLYLSEVLFSEESKLSYSPHPELNLELLLIKLSLTRDWEEVKDEDLKLILRKIQTLEERIFPPSLEGKSTPEKEILEKSNKKFPHPVPKEPLSPARILSLWPQVVEKVEKENKNLARFLKKSKILKVKNSFLTLLLPNPFLKERFEESREVIEAKLKELLLREVKLKFVTTSFEERKKEKEEWEKKVKKVMEIFQGELIKEGGENV